MEEKINNFTGLSAVLTGFSINIIAPSIDPINIKQEYFLKFSSEISNCDEILAKYAALKAQNKTDEEIGTAMLAIPSFEDPCRMLIFLWYSGAWPTIDNGRINSVLLSSKSYTSGLVWQVMQSHPMGDSNYRYGYWANKPADLQDFTGNKN